MELLAITGLGLLGTYMINNGKKEPQFSKQIITGKKNDNNIKLFPSELNSTAYNVYDTRLVPEISKDFYDKAHDQREKSKIPQRTNIIPPFFNQPYTDNKSSLTMGPVPIYNIQSAPNKLDNQFDLQKVGTNTEPASIGETYNLSQKLSSINDFTPFQQDEDMTYGITSKEHFTHNNMQPFTARRDVTNDETTNSFEYNMEIFTGSSKNWNPKRETIPFFSPEEYKQLPFGTELVTEEERNRIVPSRIRQNERPFEPVYVAPGLDLDYNEQPKHGLHDPFRVLEKDTNELRVATKPKLTYKGRIVAPERKGEGRRGISAPVIHRRPDQYRYQTGEEFVPNRAVNTAQAVTGEYILNNNARTACNGELTGTIQGPNIVGPDERDGDVHISKRVTHVEDKLGPNSTQIYNPDIESFNILETERNTTNYNDMQHANRQTSGIKYFDDNDIAKHTVKEQTAVKSLNTEIGKNPGNYANYTDISNHTKKELIATSEQNTHMGANQGSQYANLTDNAKHTIKETLTSKEFNTYINGVARSYANLSDTAKNTLKQIIATEELNNMIGTTTKETYANLTDNARSTLKQILAIEALPSFMKQNIGAYSNLSDSARTTLKELIDIFELNTNVKAASASSYAAFTDLAKATIKEYNAAQEYNTNVSTVGKGVKIDYNDIARVTHKQDLLNENYISHGETVFAKGQTSNTDARNMKQNIAREVISQGVYPTLSGPKVGPTKDNYNSLKLNDKPNYFRVGAPGLTTKINTDDRKNVWSQQIKQKVGYDERLYHELLEQNYDNPIINNIQTVTGSSFRN